jgi:hypothetical protein
MVMQVMREQRDRALSTSSDLLGLVKTASTAYTAVIFINHTSLLTI